MQFSVPIQQLFAYGSLDLRDTKKSFLNDVATTLISRNRNIATDVEILIGTGINLPDLSGISDNLAGKRVSVLAQSLMDQGVPSRNISIGLEAGDAGLVHFSFYLRPSLTFQFRPESGLP